MTQSHFLTNANGFSIVFRLQTTTGLLKTRNEEMPFHKWHSSVVGRQTEALAQLTAWIDDGIAVSAHAHVEVPGELVAGLSAARASALGLPPFTDLALHGETESTIDRPEFAVRYGWRTFGGQPVRGVRRTGAWLDTPRGPQLVPLHLLALVTAIDEFREQETASDDSRWRAWQKLSAALPQTDDGNLRADPYLRSFTIAHATRFGLEPRPGGGPLDLDPVLFGQPEQPIDGTSEGEQADMMATRLLPQALLGKFVDERFRQGAQVQARQTLAPGSYLVLDQSLQRALQVVRDKERGTSDAWREFLRNPVAGLAEAIGEDAEDSAIEALFVETEGYSARVTELGLWSPPVLPWIKLDGRDWFGAPDEGADASSRRNDRMGLRIGDRFVDLSSADLAALEAQVRAAAAAGQPTAALETPEGIVDVPTTAQTIAAIEKLKERQSSDRATDGQEGQDDRQVLMIVTNFEAPDFRSARPKRQDHGVGNEPGLVTTKLKPHQEEGLAWLRERWLCGAAGALLADDMGLGKTLQALAFLDFVRRAEARSGRQRPLLVVAPTSLLGNWEAEHDLHLAAPGLGSRLALWGASLRRATSDSAQGRYLDTSKLAQNGWLLTTYETLRDHHRSLAALPLAAVVFDEVQKIKNPGSLVSHAARTLNADFTLAVTGTPVENRLSDLWSIADCTEPGLLGDLKTFSKRFEQEGADIQPLKSLIGEGAPSFMLRRLKTERLEGLPEKSVKAVENRMPPEQAAAYDAALQDARSGTMGDALRALQGIRRISLTADPLDGSTPMEDLIRKSARLAAFASCVKQVADRREKLLIFVEYLALQPILAAWLQTAYSLDHLPLVINGATPGAQRQKLVDRFQAGKPGFDAMILGPKSAGVGLTLTAANHVVHLTRWWNPAVEDQCTDRVYRIGQHRPVTVWLPQSIHPERVERSFDLILDQLLARKRDLSSSALNRPGFTGG